MYNSHGRICDIEGCTRYSDVDVYFFNDTTQDMCLTHAGKHWDDPSVMQVVPQHMGETNVSIYEINQAIEVIDYGIILVWRFGNELKRFCMARSPEKMIDDGSWVLTDIRDPDLWEKSDIPGSALVNDF